MESFTLFLVALCTAGAIGLVSIIFVLRWVLYYKEGLGWDGGLAEFNWHPVLIVTGFVFLQGLGEQSLTFLFVTFQRHGGRTGCVCLVWKTCKHSEEILAQSSTKLLFRGRS